MKKTSILGLISIISFFSPCLISGGVGNIITESRQVSGFHQVSLGGSGELHIIQGNQEALTVEADADLMPYIRTEVENGTLYLGLKRHSWWKSIWQDRRVKFNLIMKDINNLDLSGSGNINVPDINTDDLELRISGSGDINVGSLTAKDLVVRVSGSGDCKIAGETDHQEVKISGSGKVRSPDLVSKTAEVRISGSGQVIIRVRSQLDVRISGSGNVDYYGSPKVKQTITGSGKVRSLGDILR